MTPSPISMIEHTLSDIGLRDRWTNGDLDKKAVGGHFVLGKRNSTPVGIISPYSPMKMPTSLNQMTQQTHMVSTVASLPVASEVNASHRRLDRTQSEPLRAQIPTLVDRAASAVAAAATSSSRYKTELCRPFGETGFCKYGEKCQFAHGCNELRNMPRHPKYKTELCRTFHTTGLCAYGTRCHFIHNADERRHPSSPEAQSPIDGSGPLGMPFSLDNETCVNPLGPSPPSSIHGSPTSQGGAFFDDSFNVGSLAPSDDLAHYNVMGLETPPVSPVESLAGDMDNLSLSPALSNSPPPPVTNTFGPMVTGMANTNNLGSSMTIPPNVSPNLKAFWDWSQGVRLPIFETLTEVQ